MIVPHEICVKKATANMMITYYEFHYCKQLAKPQFIANYYFLYYNYLTTQQKEG